MRISDLFAYAICLERNPPTQKAVQSWHKAFLNVKISAAVDAKHLQIEKDNRVHPLAKMYVKNPIVGADSVFALPSKGAVGCALSHYALYNICIQRNEPIIVIEQDVVFSPRAIEVLKQLEVPDDADFVSLLYIRQHDTVPYSRRFDRLVGPHCDGNQCYMITPRGAATVLSKAFPIVTQCDLMIGIVANTSADEFRGYVLRERLYSYWSILRDNMGSSIQQFRFKKYLPRSNIFYLFVLFLMLALSVAVAYFVIRAV